MMPAEGAAGARAAARHARAPDARARDRRRGRRLAGRARRRDARRARRATSCASRAATGSARGACRPSSRPSSRRPAREGQESWRAAREADDFAAFAPALQRNVELARAYGECVAERRRARLRRRCSATTTSACAREELRARLRRRSPRRCRRWSARPQRALAAAHAGGARGRAGSGRRGRSLRRVGVDARELARGRLGAPVHRLDRHARQRVTTRYGDGERRVAAELAARVRPRALRAPDRPGAATARTSAAARRCRSTSPRASCGRTTSRAAAPSPRCSPPSSPSGGFAVSADGAARDARRRRAVADPRLGRPAHLPAAHRPALRARAGADRRRRSPSPTCPRRGARACAACSASRCPPTRSAACRTSTGAAGSFGYFPSYALGCLIAAQLWEAIERELGPREEDLRRGEVGAIQAWLAEHVHRHGRRLDTLPLRRAGDRRSGSRSSRSCATWRRSPAAERRAPRLLALLQHRQHVAGRVLEPGDVRAAAAHDPALVLLEAVVALDLRRRARSARRRRPRCRRPGS